jgi:hypothetical protein
MTLFDYIFYRTFNFFDRKGDDISDEKATNLVVLLECFLLIDLYILVRKVINIDINQNYYNKWLWGISLFLIIGILGHIRYKKRFKKDNYSFFHNKWGKEDKQHKTQNGWLIILFIIVVIFALPLLSLIK